jgi:hypothetical protein
MLTGNPFKDSQFSATQNQGHHEVIEPNNDQAMPTKPCRPSHADQAMPTKH